MIDKPPERFLMTPAQHRQWAPNARRGNRPDLAQHHEKLAGAIEIAGGGGVAAVATATAAGIANQPDDSAIIVLGAGPGEATVAELPARLAPRRCFPPPTLRERRHRGRDGARLHSAARTSGGMNCDLLPLIWF